MNRSCQCGQAHGACTTAFEYAVKIVCGPVAPATPGAPAPVVAPGQYWTATNIHNPDKCKVANIRWKVAVAKPGEVGPVTAYRNLRPLEPDTAIEIDCPQIMQVIPHQPAPITFVKGFLVIESDIELDVVAVYSGAPAAGAALNSFHTERVQPRCVPVCEDLILPLHTGLMGWRTMSPTAGPVALLNAPGAPVPFGASVVSQLATDWTVPNPATLLTYELCFDLCFGFEAKTLLIQGFANDSAQVSLNGFALGSLPNALTTITPPPNWQNSLKAGRNCLRVLVSNNANSTTAFALGGILQVARGKCPCSPLPLAQRPAGVP
jgi:hypothetical protein